MGFYDRYILPPLINLACSSKPNMKQREKIVPLAEGEVLEIGVGSGLNLSFYDTDKVRKVWGLEPSEGMRKLARKKLVGSQLEVEMIDLPGEEIPLDANSVDSLLESSGFRIVVDERMYIPGVKLLSYNYWGSAVGD
jgi:ubiquinone/menaquinone biosynthesis C-methylase UbiE